MKAIIPKKLLFDPAALSRVIENALEGAAKAAQADFLTTTATWKHKPDFKIERRAGYRLVFTDDKIYGFVTGGTKAHVIRAKAGGVLRFSSEFAPKTTPRQIGSGPGGRGPADTVARVVHHPGTAAREFEQEIAKKWQDDLPETIQRAIDSEVR